MGAFALPGNVGRRSLLLAGAAACWPLQSRAIGIYTPHELAQQYERQVAQRLSLPDHEARIYGGMAELQLITGQRALWAPQYLLVVDSDPHVQAALLFWRLAPGQYELLGASPVSTGGPVRPDHFQTPQGVFEQRLEANEAAATCAAPPVSCRRDARIFDFGWQRTRRATGRGPLLPMRLQAHAADREAQRTLGTACSNGCILLPPSLMSYLDRFGLLDAALPDDAPQKSAALPYRGRFLLVVDSERGDRPQWSPLPA